jgi:hypothetical protein
MPVLIDLVGAYKVSTKSINTEIYRREIIYIPTLINPLH